MWKKNVIVIPTNMVKLQTDCIPVIPTNMVKCERKML